MYNTLTQKYPLKKENCHSYKVAFTIVKIKESSLTGINLSILYVDK